MEVVFGIPLLIVPFILPLIAGLMAKTYGRSFWTWFLIGIPLPFIANIILLCLPDRTANKRNKQKAAKAGEKTGQPENNEIEEIDIAVTA